MRQLGYDDALRRWPWAWHNDRNNFAEVRVMRTILVGVVAMMVVAVAGPAFAGPSATAKGCNPGAMEVGGAVHYTNPTGRVIEERRHSAGTEFGLAVAASSINLVYFPFRLIYGAVGAELGGFGGWTTGGDMRTAKGIWRPTTEGHYFVRPDYLDGTERFRFCGAVPTYREPDVVEERVVTSREMVYEPAPPPAGGPAPVVEPESSDTNEDAL